MILATVLTAYFVLLICQQTSDIARSRRLYTASRIRRGMLSNSDMVEITRQRYAANQYHVGSEYVANFDLLYSCQYKLSKSNRLYQICIHRYTGFKTAHFISRHDAISTIQYCGNGAEELEILSAGNYSKIFLEIFPRLYYPKTASL